MQTPGNLGDTLLSPVGESIARRLKRRFGVDVDPHIELDRGEPKSGASAAASTAASTASGAASAVLGRLQARGPVATRYRLEGEIARGGMGAILEVYDEDIRRRLAMKVALGRDDDVAAALDPALLSRFLEEAQVTGQLDHPGIVPVHELGVDAQGRAYFTMRLVRGRDLSTVFRDVDGGADGWTTTRAVGALLKVCEAMAYAHAKGVVHRDLKPANVMIGQFGEVYVMDWGLARVRGATERHDVRVQRDAVKPAERNARPIATDRREGSSAGAGAELLTMDGDVLGTPSYMPPEQARGRVEDIDERSDIYSVGAMLYRVLAREAPYASEDGESKPIEVLTSLLAGPPRPIEERRADAPAELVAICEKAMARERAQRYASMQALADDLRAYLEGRVVSAFEQGSWATARKWVARNKALSSSVAAAVLALACGLGASLWFWRRADRNAEFAESQRLAAQASAEVASREAAISREVNAFLNNDLLASVAPEFDGAKVLVRDVLDRAAEKLEGRFGSEPEIESALRMTIGRSYANLGVFEGAREQFERVLEIRRQGPEPVSEPTLDALLGAAAAWSSLGRREDAVALYRDALEMIDRLPGAPAQARVSALSDLGLVFRHMGRLDEARECYEDAITMGRRDLGEDDRNVLTARGNLAQLSVQQGRIDEALDEFEQVLERERVVFGPRHPQTIDVQGNLGRALADAGRLEESEALARETVELCRAVYGDDHPNTGTACGVLGSTLTRMRRLDEAEPFLQEALDNSLHVYGEEHALSLLARQNLASLWVDRGESARALEACEPLLEAQRRILGDTHPDTLIAINRLACIYQALRRYDDAQALYLEGIDLHREVYGDDHPATIVILENYAGLLFAKGDAVGAEPLVRDVLAARIRVLGADHIDVAKTQFNLGMVLLAEGQSAQARQVFEASLRRDSGTPLESLPSATESLRKLGDLDLAEEQYASAVASYGEALRLMRARGRDDATAAYCLHQIGSAQRRLGELEAAQKTLHEAFELRARLLGRDAEATRITMFQEARVLTELGRYEAAETLALELHALVTSASAPSSPQLVSSARKTLETLYEAWGKPDEAAQWR